MACLSTSFRAVSSSILRRNATVTASRIALPATSCLRLFHASPATLDAQGFNDILSRAKHPIAADNANNVLQEFDTMMTQIGNQTISEEEYHLHIYSTKHNTHITFTDPKKNPIISMSTGNIGFKKAQRGTYDAAYQLASHVFTKLDEKNLMVKSLEVVLRDFGEGREAVVKALLGTEGRNLKWAIKRVTDASRLKFGGTRSKKPRRLVGFHHLSGCWRSSVGGLRAWGLTFDLSFLLDIGLSCAAEWIELYIQRTLQASNQVSPFVGAPIITAHCPRHPVS